MALDLERGGGRARRICIYVCMYVCIMVSYREREGGGFGRMVGSVDVHGGIRGRGKEGGAGEGGGGRKEEEKGGFWSGFRVRVEKGRDGYAARRPLRVIPTWILGNSIISQLDMVCALTGWARAGPGGVSE